MVNYICIYTMGEKSPYTHIIRTQNQRASPAISPSRHVVLTLPHRTVPCSAVTREEWLPKSGCPSLHHQRRVAQSCGRLLSHHYSTNTPTNVTKDMEAHQLACPSQRCTNGSTGNVITQYVRDFQRIMTDYYCTVLGVR